MHLVHVNNKYPTIEVALGNDDGLAVMGFFLESSDSKKPFAVRPIRPMTEKDLLF